MLGQPPREVLIRMAGDHLWRKHTEVCPRGSWWAECASLSREQLADGIVELILHVVKVTLLKVEGQVVGPVWWFGAIRQVDHKCNREAPLEWRKCKMVAHT